MARLRIAAHRRKQRCCRSWGKRPAEGWAQTPSGIGNKRELRNQQQLAPNVGKTAVHPALGVGKDPESEDPVHKPHPGREIIRLFQAEKHQQPRADLGHHRATGRDPGPQHTLQQSNHRAVPGFMGPNPSASGATVQPGSDENRTRDDGLGRILVFMEIKSAALPGRKEQILRMHADLIRGVVFACHNPALQPELEAVLRASEANGWTALAGAIRQILKGRRDVSLLLPLDADDQVIIEAILLGLRDPATLPPEIPPDPALAVPGLSALVDAALKGDIESLSAIASMAQQMTHAGGELARMGAALSRLLQGERDPDRLTEGMERPARNLLLALIEDLGRRRAQ